MTNRSILLIEDEQDLADLLQLHLRRACDELCVVHDGITGLDAVQQRPWGLVILDIGLPGASGFTICRHLRSLHARTSVIMLTARDTEEDRIRGLEIGADDYVTKPFSVRELLARVNACFRRSAAYDEPTANRRLLHKGLALDPNSRQVNDGDNPVGLTAREFDLLAHFMQHPKQVFTRTQLLDRVWGHGHDGYKHTVNSHINRLRSKIERDPSHPEHIVTVWGVGYRLG
ncbi:MAG: response regulator transcription factor [Gammaproteobacteria bacterium]|nr:response regulator transcription factor [Gammaproteobacteria bacterium]